MKYTTRKPRPEEAGRGFLDLYFPPDTKEQFAQRSKSLGFYCYTYGNDRTGYNEYGFYASDIRTALEEHDSAFIIVRSTETISRVKADFPAIRCVSVFIYTDRDLVTERLHREGYSDDAIDFRLERLPSAWSDYLKHSGSYDDKIINNSNHTEYELLVESLYERFTSERADEFYVSGTESFPLAPPLVGFKQEMQRRLAATRYDRNVFVMMKFRPTNRRLFDFIRRTLERHSFNCIRADDPYWNITRNTYNPVAVLYCCKYGIALFDQPEDGNIYSANVAYELGMMHQQRKECLILRHTTLPTVPFDLAKDLYVDYDDNLELEERLDSWVSVIA
jgi:guanylate kinase